MIIPSIDLMDGKAVQLEQGAKKILEREDVLALATEFRKYGEIAVIDLNAALGTGNNFALIQEICKIAPCRVGGGIRTLEKGNQIMQAGARKIIIGTAASVDFLQQFPKSRIIVALDSRGGKVATHGWQKTTTMDLLDQIEKFEPYCSEFLCTNIDREGLLQGIDKEYVRQIRAKTSAKLTIAGGITTIEEVQFLETQQCNSQIGMAIYTNQMALSDLFIAQLDFPKMQGLIPTIVQDHRNQVVMFAYSSQESLVKTFKTGMAWYYSRSRKKLWMKGETSENTQAFQGARYDCDRDCLLFHVVPKGDSCHVDQYSCFGEKNFTLQDTFEIIKKRMENPLPNSYTSKILQNENKIKEKIQEEALEVINYQNEGNLIWEIADLFFFVMILMNRKQITLQDIENELWRRRK